MGEITLRPLGRPGDLGWILLAHGEQYAEEFGFGPGFEAHVAGAVADLAGRGDGQRERTWIAELDGRRVGSVACTAAGDPATAQLRVLLVHPDARGQRLGTRLVDTCVGFAREAGYRRIRLWTVDVLVTARRIYLAAGFRITHEAPHRAFGQDLIGQDYLLDLPTA